MMTTPESGSETSRTTAETKPDKWPFDELHEDIKGQCNCVDELGAIDDISTSFTRCVGQNPCDATWFRSFREMNKKLHRALLTWTDKCKYRGVSINKLTSNKEEIKTAYTLMKLVSPKAGVFVEGKYVCTFRMTLKAGKVADTSNDKPEGHHTLLKCDGFDITHIVILDTVTIEEF